MNGQTPTQITHITPPVIFQQEFLQWINKPEEVFIWIRQNLSGKILEIDENGKEKWVKKGKPMMSNEGVEAIIQELWWYTNKFTFHADYTEEQIDNILLSIANNFDIFLARNWRKFKIDPSVFYSGVLSDGIIGMVESSYRMSGMRKFYEDVLQVRQGFPVAKEKKKILGIFPKP